jgi:redox-sensing transcriptional repressor
MRKPPGTSINRLAVYLRFLENRSQDGDAKSTISSEEFARSLEINPNQIRKDLSYFGKFGRQGIGYNIEELKEQIREILGLHRKWKLCLCGAGNLGSALSSYRGFRERNLNIAAIFDSDPAKIHKRIDGIMVYDSREIKTVVRRLGINIAIIAVPADAADRIAERLVVAGVRAILNFAPVKINVPAGVKLRNVDLSTELINLTYFLSSVFKPGV